MDGWVDGWVDGWMDGWTDGRMDGWMDGWMDGRMDGWMDRWTLDTVMVLTLSSLKYPATEPGWKQRECLLMGRTLALTPLTTSGLTLLRL